MAARRIVSLLTSRYSPSFLSKESSSRLQAAIAIAPKTGLIFRRIQTFTEDSRDDKGGERLGNSALELTNESAGDVSGPGDQTNLEVNVISRLKVSPRHDVAMFFTCSKCETRSMKFICRESYEKGVVVARCGGCSNLHLIADRLGWFGEPGSVEEFLALKGEEVKKGSVDTLNLLADLTGKKNVVS
ncbi:hypothetical protein LIER_07817 [Lithospermum erythrorhizon]|uniref:DNL-type domain-containing protein n=1 Tax=Lithospermum erythrorhizon TaxID=34254 RepID=A0AAV3PAY4_LITER